MYEISYLLSKLRVEKIMTKNVITVQANEVVEEAARIMADNGIGCLPVMKNDVLVGIITESDLFHAFVDMFSARQKGVRVTFTLAEKPGMLALITQAIFSKNANIISLITGGTENTGEAGAGIRRCACKVEDISISALKEIFEQAGATVEDIR
jgi:acetoin utilization protein AcuB